MNNLSAKEIEMKFYKELMKPLPVGNHPFWAEVYDNFSKKYNSLADELVNKGIDINKLLEFQEAVQLFERLGQSTAYELGLRDAMKCIINR